MFSLLLSGSPRNVTYRRQSSHQKRFHTLRLQAVATRLPSIPLTEANARMIKLGLSPMLSGLDIAYYRSKAESDPVLALAGLRIDLEMMMRNVTVGFKLQFAASGPIPRLLGRLKEAGAITPDQMQLAQKIFNVCNQAMHGRFVSRQEAEEVIEAAEVLFRQYLAWLSWGFNDNWKPSQP